MIARRRSSHDMRELSSFVVQLRLGTRRDTVDLQQFVTRTSRMIDTVPLQKSHLIVREMRQKGGIVLSELRHSPPFRRCIT